MVLQGFCFSVGWFLCSSWTCRICHGPANTWRTNVFAVIRSTHLPLSSEPLATESPRRQAQINMPNVVRLTWASPVSAELLGAALESYVESKSIISTFRLCVQHGNPSHAPVARLPAELVSQVVEYTRFSFFQKRSREWEKVHQCLQNHCSFRGDVSDDDDEEEEMNDEHEQDHEEEVREEHELDHEEEVGDEHEQDQKEEMCDEHKQDYEEEVRHDNVEEHEWILSRYLYKIGAPASVGKKKDRKRFAKCRKVREPSPLVGYMFPY